MKSFISAISNIYYEAIDRLNPSDIEVPRRPSQDHTFLNGVWIDNQQLHPQVTHHQNFPFQVPVQQVQQPSPGQQAQANLSDLVNVIKQLQTINNASNQPDPLSAKKDPAMGGFIGEKFTWKDLITVLYFAGGIVGLWMHMNERIIVLEQKVVTIEKGNAELQSSFKEFIVKNENQLKGIDSKISDLQQMVISRISSQNRPGK
jgi:hypothetical protein